MASGKFSAIAAAVLALAWATPALAQDEAQSDGWQFRIAPYLIIPSMEGDVTVRGLTAETDVGPEDIFSRLNMGFQGYFEARTPDWGVGLDVIYMDLDATDDARLADVDVSQIAITPIVFGRVAPNLDLYAGARYNDLGVDLDFRGPNVRVTAERNKSWVDPLIGARFAAPIGKKWNFEIAADVGGFGIGSDIAVNVWPMVTYELSRSAELAFGYRVLYMDYESGSGTDAFGYDMLTMGPVVGAVFGF